jgi:nicotinamidase-related amidase
MKKIVLIVVVALLAIPVLAQEKTNEVKVMKPALLVIDIQNQYKGFIPEMEREMGIMMMNFTISLFRQHHLPIIRVYHSDAEWGVPKPGSEEFQFWKEVNIDSSDVLVLKHYPNGFKKTDLDKILKEKGINTIFLTGLSAVGCVLATYHGGKDLDYNTFLVKNAIMSHEKEFTDVIEEAYEAIGWDAMKFMLDYMRK